MTRSRDEIIRELTRHCGDGRLTLDELEERIGEVYAATTDAELLHALRELPGDRSDWAAPRREAPAPEREAVVPDVALPSGPPQPRTNPEWEKTVGTLCTIGGFVLLFNGMFILAMLCWFVLPGLVVRHRRCG